MDLRGGKPRDPLSPTVYACLNVSPCLIPSLLLQISSSVVLPFISLPPLTILRDMPLRKKERKTDGKKERKKERKRERERERPTKKERTRPRARARATGGEEKRGQFKVGRKCNPLFCLIFVSFSLAKRKTDLDLRSGKPRDPLSLSLSHGLCFSQCLALSQSLSPSSNIFLRNSMSSFSLLSPFSSSYNSTRHTTQKRKERHRERESARGGENPCPQAL